MIRYEMQKSNDEIFVFGYEQSFSDEERANLWDKHKILYIGNIMAVWVEERDDYAPLIHLMREDDGCLIWSKNKDVCFDAGWLDDYINTLTAVKAKLRVHKLRK